MKLICIGDNNVDIYPEEGLIYPGGNCVNVAAFCAINGSEVCYVGNLGNDNWGDIQENALHHIGVSTVIFRQPEKTSSAEVRLFGNDRRFSAYDNEIHTAHPLKLDLNLEKKIKQYDLVHTSRYSIFDSGTINKIIACGKPVSYDFSNDWETNETEQLSSFLAFSFFSCDGLSEKEIWNLLNNIVCSGCGLAIATQGANGSFAYDGKNEYRQPAFHINPVDTLGAGDSFIAKFLQTYFDLFLPNSKSLNVLSEHGEFPDLSALHQNIVKVSLSQAALFSAEICLKKAAFAEPTRSFS